MKQYRVWNIINPPSKPHYHEVDDPQGGHDLIDRLANQQLADVRVVDNAFGLEVYEDGDWSEWYDEQGRDVAEAFGSAEARAALA